MEDDLTQVAASGAEDVQDETDPENAVASKSKTDGDDGIIAILIGL